MSGSEEAPTPASRWPKVIGTIGIVLAVIMFFDIVTDLLFYLTWPDESVSGVLPPEAIEIIEGAMPSTGSVAFTTLVQTVVAAILMVGSVRLRRRQRSGAALCKAWSWSVIVLLLIDVAIGAARVASFTGEITATSQPGWQATAAFSILVALAVLFAYPIFLLVWLGKPQIREELATWAP